MGPRPLGRLLSSLIWLAALCAGPRASQAAGLTPELQIHRIQLEHSLEARLKDTLAAYLGTPDVVPVVTVTLIVEESVRREGDDKSSKSVEYVLPGVPVDQGLTKKKEILEKIRNADRVVSATVFVGKALDAARLEQAKQIASQVLELNASKGDSLQFKTFESKTPSSKADLLLYAAIAAAAGLLLACLTLVYFLFVPLPKLVDVVTEALGKRAPSTGAELPAFGSGGAGSGMPGAEAAAAPAAAAGRPASPDEEPMFDFIGEDNIPGLVQALGRENEMLIASVLECLPRPLAAKAFSQFPPEKRRDILLQTRSVKYGNPESIRMIEKQIRRKLGFSFGGVRKMCQIIQRTDSRVRVQLIRDIEQTDSELAQHMRDNLLEFEDLFSYDDRSFLRIFRELSLQSFARFLKASTPGLTDRVCERLSPELADLLREQISFMPPVPPEAADEEFIRIVDVVERLKTAGLIHTKEDRAKERV